jgi:cellulose synthase/poly-beta-1,6-N-acetylglucosamine synthase-like glycosyltransferase
VSGRAVRISVLIPTWRRAAALARCLDGLDRQDRTPAEVIVVSRPGDEETATLLAERQAGASPVRAVAVERPGVVAALNQGLAAAGGDLLALTDDDTVAPADWLARVERWFAGDPGLGALGGRDRLHPPSTEPEQRTVGKVRWYGRVVGNHHLGVGAPRDVDVLKGANLALRRAALGDARLDERLRGAGAQVHWEIDLCYAVRRAGWKLVYDPAVCVDHYPAERFDDELRLGPATGVTLEHVIHNETYLLLKWLPASRRAAARLYWELAGTRYSPGLAVLGERLLRDRDRGAVLDRYRTARRGRRAGVRTFRAARRGQAATG